MTQELIGEFNTYDPARIKSHPGVSTELSPVSPANTLVTDFFGGVASVEIQGSEAKLPLRKAPAPWRTVRRAKTIGKNEDLTRFDRVKSVGRPVSPGGWKKPLERREGGQAWLGGLLMAGAAGYVFWRSSQRSKAG